MQTFQRKGVFFAARCRMATHNTHAGPRVMTVNELADYLKIHRTTVYRLLKDRRIPAFRVGSDWRFNKEIIDEWRLNSTV
jgi:excisionase family DNA binding protein